MTNDNLNERLLDIMRNRFYGKYRGLVTDNQDPTNRGRVQVTVPAVLADLKVWALPCLPITGKGMGSYWIPDAGAGVWVEFEAGDSSFPVWTGGFWADDELPQDQNSDKTVPSIKIIRSSKGLMIVMNDDTEVITLSDSDGKNIMTIDSQAGKVRIEGNAKVVVQAPLIELVENSTHPLVFGDLLLEYLNQLVNLYQTHTHPGELALGVFPITPAPPVPPFPPATSELLSQIVTTG
jgi:Type VI secretion system/phage-baseplate injector OB domain